jgi:phage antirepressor YoqD-like protein
MTYSAEISRDHPTAILFVIDQSRSMEDQIVNGRPKAEFVADVLNKTVYTLVTNCSKAEGYAGILMSGCSLTAAMASATVLATPQTGTAS